MFVCSSDLAIEYSIQQINLNYNYLFVKQFYSNHRNHKYKVKINRFYGNVEQKTVY